MDLSGTNGAKFDLTIDSYLEKIPSWETWADNLLMTRTEAVWPECTWDFISSDISTYDLEHLASWLGGMTEDKPIDKDVDLGDWLHFKLDNRTDHEFYLTIEMAYEYVALPLEHFSGRIRMPLVATRESVIRAHEQLVRVIERFPVRR